MESFWEEEIAKGTFAADIEKVVVEQIRASNDFGLSRLGFILKIAVHLFDADEKMSWLTAKTRASEIYLENNKENGIDFGDEGWDWTGDGARILAHEYEIGYWDE